MVRTIKIAALVTTLAFAATPVLAEGLELPIVGVLPTPGNGLDLDPLHIFTPEPAAAPAEPAPMKKKHHHMMHKKMMKKTM
ncbi:hypothetical protein RHAL1_03826 [Beijerinckiaceae bacterium RH AL1]|nr:hypothetical protein [Beijerinckiaceae bacterium]VVB49417.1 hypothetical protein RHCH11_RHCH11_03752 [Beijerinckiaceae bacterium RH CH11]VVB49498.1 hypothetical protein RHAL8_03748 [Beijerinckiaceae bacterium RH AL8]VVC56892.1 hypothetical protein RHAL1_03826 [Beijerinckiaceae bacterium RH AL1]